MQFESYIANGVHRVITNMGIYIPVGDASLDCFLS